MPEKISATRIPCAPWTDQPTRKHLNPDILKKFNEDLGGNVAKADKNWPGLVKKNAK